MYSGYIEDYIPYGAENAIERYDLRVKAEISSDSTMRMEVSGAKLRVPIVSSCKTKGYYRPRADRPEEVKAAKDCRDELFHKARTIMAQLKTFDQFINPSGQLDLFGEVD